MVSNPACRPGVGDGRGCPGPVLKGVHVRDHHCYPHSGRQLRRPAADRLPRHRLPPHHEKGATRELLKIATGMLATLVALILGLLVSSAKDTFDTATAEITQSGAQIITLNRMLARLRAGSAAGANAAPAQPGRQHRARLAGPAVSQYPPSSATMPRCLMNFRKSIRKLAPQNDAQKQLQAKAEAQTGQPGRSDAGSCSSRCRTRCRRCS